MINSVSRSLLVLTLLLMVVAVFFVFSAVTSQPSVSSSPEIGVATESPRGSSAGLVIPASCPSYEHFPTECDPPSFTATPPIINSGGCTTLTWSCVNSVSSNGVNFNTGGAVSGSVPVCPVDDTDYTVICSNTGQSQLTVTVLEPGVAIDAAPDRVRSGNGTTITWFAQDVIEDSCVVTDSNGAVFATGESGEKTTGPLSAEETYTLTCQDEGGPAMAKIIVRILPSFEEF